MRHGPCQAGIYHLRSIGIGNLRSKVTCGTGLLATVVGLAIVLPIFLNALYFLNPNLDFACLHFKKKLISPLLMRYGFNIWLAVTALATATVLASWQSDLFMLKQ